jgi:PhnB protein
MAFGANDMGRVPDAERPERLMHAQVEINGGCLMLTDHAPEGAAPFSGLKGMHMQLVVNDGRAWWDRALAAGCTVVMPYERQPWGDDWGMVEDPFGIQWAILQPGPERGE